MSSGFFFIIILYVYGRDLQLECARILHETLLVHVLMYGNETMSWKEEERSRVVRSEGGSK